MWLWWLFISATVQNSHSFNLGSCQVLSRSDYSNPCTQVVDYSYYLPWGIHEFNITSRVTSALGDPKISLLPTNCQQALLKEVCTSSYLRCTSSNNLVYGEIGEFFPLPFQRPCLRSCVEVSDRCLGLLGLLGITNDCNGTFDYSMGMISSKPKKFDLSNDPSKCNYPEIEAPIGKSSEPYIFPNGVCSGIIKELYVPPAIQIGPMIPPFVVQSAIESELSLKLSQIPSWLSTDCHFALRKYFCGQYMMKPEILNFFGVLSAATNLPVDYVKIILSGMGLNSSGLEHFSLTVPSFPHRSVCEEYSSKCSDFITISQQPLLMANCSSMSRPSIHNFPTENQTIIEFVASIGGSSVPIPLTSSPNRMLQAVDLSSHAVVCPEGFVVPEEPDNPNILWIPASGCALACKSPYKTSAEWESYDKLIVTSSAIGIPLVLLFLIRWHTSRTKRKQYLVLCFAWTSFVGSLCFLIVSNLKWENRFCRNNAVSISSADGFTACGFQSILIIYTAMSCSLSWLMQTVDIFLKVVFNMKTDRFFWVYLGCIFGLPWISCIYVLAKGWYGYGGLPWCFISSVVPDRDADMGFFYIPAIVITCIGTILIGVVIFIALKAIWRMHLNMAAEETNRNVSLLERLNILRVPIAYTSCFIVFWATILSFRMVYYFKGKHMRSSFQDFVVCVFQNFDGKSQNSWREVCGTHAKLRFSETVYMWVFFCVSGQSILVSIIYLQPFYRIGKFFYPHFIAICDYAMTMSLASVVLSLVPSTQVHPDIDSQRRVIGVELPVVDGGDNIQVEVPAANDQPNEVREVGGSHSIEGAAVLQVGSSEHAQNALMPVNEEKWV